MFKNGSAVRINESGKPRDRPRLKLLTPGYGRLRKSLFGTLTGGPSSVSQSAAHAILLQDLTVILTTGLVFNEQLSLFP